MDFPHQAFVFLCALGVDDVREQGHLVLPGNRVAAVISPHEPYAIADTRLSDKLLGDFKRSGKIEDRGSEFWIFPAKMDWIGARTRAHVEQLGNFAKIDRLGQNFGIPAR